MEQILYSPARTQFPVTVELGGQAYQFDIWHGQQLPDRLLAYDTETRLIEGPGIPELALATVCGNAQSCYFIHPDDLPQ